MALGRLRRRTQASLRSLISIGQSPDNTAASTSEPGDVGARSWCNDHKHIDDEAEGHQCRSPASTACRRTRSTGRLRQPRNLVNSLASISLLRRPGLTRPRGSVTLPAAFQRDFIAPLSRVYGQAGGRLPVRPKHHPKRPPLASARAVDIGAPAPLAPAPAPAPEDVGAAAAIYLFRSGRALRARPRGAPASRVCAGRRAFSESVLRQYPEEKELHERVRLYLNICQRQATQQRSRAADHRRAPLRRDARHQRRAVRPGDRPSAAGARRGSRQRSRDLHARRRARAARRARRSRGASRSERSRSIPRTAPSPATIPISSRCADDDAFRAALEAPLVSRGDRRRPLKTRSRAIIESAGRPGTTPRAVFRLILMNTHVVILAAGKGTRMKSARAEGARTASPASR